MNEPAPSPSRLWIWYVCGLLLLATTINYMDRQTLANAASRVQADLDLNNEQYGELEMWFAIAFGSGALIFGAIADKVGVRWLYPTVLALWSVMGFATGFVETFGSLLICRTLLGLFESGHWPCALKTVQRLLPPRDRTMGNSILQSGTSVGAIATPLIMNWMLTDEPGSWRIVFQIIGAVGLFWIVLWFTAVREEPAGAPPPVDPQRAGSASMPTSLFIRRIIVLIIVVATINACWHLFRAWLPKFLTEGRGYAQSDALKFTSAFYVATDIGCILAGAATLWFHRTGLAVIWSRWLVFLLCSLLTTLSVVISITPAGPWLMALLLLLGAGALGLFPCYYSLSQELTIRHQGKLSGLLGAVAWFSVAPLHPLFGQYVDETKSYDLGVAVAGCLPLIGCIAWALLWDMREQTERHVAAARDE
ncbi:MAG: MFS transporter [Planctomycetaceae bacterium]|nr:MFS transporter [Planctomycetaceae bacterium]